MPVGKALPIEHVVLMMQENRSFDHYFSQLTHGGVHTAPEDTELLDRDGVPYKRHHETRLCINDITHSWNGSHMQWNDGANDGFAKAAGGADPGRALGYYDEGDIPYYYALARNFAISDMHFASLLGPTWPNRMFYTAGTSFGSIRNEFPHIDSPVNIFEALGKAGVDFRIYASDAPTMLLYTETFSRFSDRVVPYDQFYVDAAAGTLPAFAMVEAAYLSEGKNDEHPPRNMQRGQRFTAAAINALMASPQWSKSALFLTWDEHGGFYDHVPPPAACPPGDEPKLEEGSAPGHFDRLGFRVPLIIVSPFARRGYVSHQVSDLTSVTRFVEARFDLPAMSDRDANADPLLDLFDFEHPDTRVPEMPDAFIDPIRDADCP